MTTNTYEQIKNSEESVNNRYNIVLDRLIREKFFSKQKLADKIGWSRSLISMIVHGHIEPSTTQKIKVAQALGVDSRTIWDGEQK